MEQKRLRGLGLTQAPCASPGNVSAQAEPTMKTAPANPISLQPAIQVKSPQLQPATKTKTSPRLNTNFKNNRAFAVGLAGIHQQRPVRTVENKNHTVSMSRDDVHNWDTLLGSHPISKPDNTLSSASSISEDMSVLWKHREPCWDRDTGCWEAHTDIKAWSDSDGTTEDKQTPSEGRQIPQCIPQSSPTGPSSVNGAQVLSMKEQKRPRPKFNERCRRWLRDECNLGYQCNFVHEDLEYDDSPVSFGLSPCKRSNHVNLLTGTHENP